MARPESLDTGRDRRCAAGPGRLGPRRRQAPLGVPLRRLRPGVRFHGCGGDRSCSTRSPPRMVERVLARSRSTWSPTMPAGSRRSTSSWLVACRRSPGRSARRNLHVMWSSAGRGSRRRVRWLGVRCGVGRGRRSLARACAPPPSDPGSPPTTIEPLPAPPAQFTTLAYNVAGLPQGISGSDPERNLPLISPLLNDYDVVLTQEDFDWWTPLAGLLDFRNYHARLRADATHPYRTDVHPGPAGGRGRPGVAAAAGRRRDRRHVTVPADRRGAPRLVEVQRRCRLRRCRLPGHQGVPGRDDDPGRRPRTSTSTACTQKPGAGDVTSSCRNWTSRSWQPSSRPAATSGR